MPEKCLTDLPPELLDYIVTFLPHACDLRNLSRTNRNLHAFVEKDAWQTFAKKRFPSTCPPTTKSHKAATRTLTSLSKAWDTRAFVSKFIEPYGDITSFPGGKKIDRWKRPKGQTIGFTPHLDVYEEDTPSGKRETVAYSAGAEVVIRHRDWHMGRQGKEREKIRWLTYRPLTAREGQDDVTTLHLLRPRSSEHSGKQRIITGTARGDLQLLSILEDPTKEVEKTYFTTQGQPVRSSSLCQRSNGRNLLAAEVGDSKICLYEFDGTEPKVMPSSHVDVKSVATQNGVVLGKAYRAWSTNFLSDRHLAVGLGPSEEPIHVYTLTPTGLSPEYVRKFSLESQWERDVRTHDLNPAGGMAKRHMSSVYPIVGLPPSSAAASSQESQVFLSGAYDGVVRLHDLRSPRDLESTYVDPTDDSSIYSLLPRGRESLVVGTSRHNLLKVFDLRLGSKCYSYSTSLATPDSKPNNYSLFLKPSPNSTLPNASSYRPYSARSAESSIYTLASASAASPHIYAGIENNVVELAFTDVLDRHPDPVYFRPWNVSADGRGEKSWNGWRTNNVLNLSGYDQDANMKLMTQRSLNETRGLREQDAERSIEGLNARWRNGGS